MIEKRIIKVLIIDDDEFITMVYEDQLSSVPNISFKITSFLTLHEGIEASRNNEYDVLLLDLNLPDSNYLETINRIPELSETLPVLIMTSTNDEVLALKSMNQGGQDYLVKGSLERTLFIRSVLYGIERHQLKTQLKEEKEKSELLLRNILPQKIADELKATGLVEAKHFENVTVMFIDFAEFTSISTNMDPKEIVSELDICFSEFDEITQRHNLEKIKTIGDAYMCAGGIPESSSDHAQNCIKAAIEILDFCEMRYEDKKLRSQKYWRARIGIHSGPVIAGVVGSKKFSYDIWGDTVNTASRMESNGVLGRINVSDAIFNQLSSESKLVFESRGKITVKGKGEMEMYFVNEVSN